MTTNLTHYFSVLVGGFDWPRLVAGASAEVSCPFGASYFYTGPHESAVAHRLCNSSGRWEEPMTGECSFSDPMLKNLEKYTVVKEQSIHLFEIG